MSLLVCILGLRGAALLQLLPKKTLWPLYADDTTLMAEREEELKILLMKVKEIQPVHHKEINP